MRISPGLPLLAPLWAMRSRLRGLLLRDLRAQYAGSAIGAGWNILRPLLQVAAYYFAFGVVLGARQGHASTDAAYPVYLLTGLVPWLCFTEGATRGVNSLVGGAALIKKVRLPFEVLTAKAVLVPVLTYGPFVVLFWLLNAALDAPHSLLYLIAWLSLQVLLTLYLAHAMAILTVVIRDIGQAFNVLVGMMIFVSPVLYEISRVPAGFRLVMYLNPMTPFVEGYHRIVLQGLAPHLVDLIAVCAWTIAAAALAALLHRRAQDSLVDWL